MSIATLGAGSQNIATMGLGLLSGDVIEVTVTSPACLELAQDIETICELELEPCV